jgi:hypothetical protein
MGTVPFSNPAGNNQTNPVSSLMPKGPAAAPAGGTTGLQHNPYMPTSSTAPAARPMAGGQIPGTPNPTGSPVGPSIPNVGGLGNSPSNSYGTTGGLDKQLGDIWGKGVGGALGKLLEGMSGTDSQVLQEYIASLQPQMAKAQANTNAALGAGGVSANSSVAAIADSNLQSQESAAIAGESASLTKSQEQLTAEILTGMQPAAQKEVATSGWSIFGDVMSQITGDIGNLLPTGASKPNSNSNNTTPTTPGPSMSPGQLPFGSDSSMSTAPPGWDSAANPALNMAPFS